MRPTALALRRRDLRRRRAAAGAAQATPAAGEHAVRRPVRRVGHRPGADPRQPTARSSPRCRRPAAARRARRAQALRGDSAADLRRRCCRPPPCGSAAPRSTPSPTRSPASTTTATCTSACSEELERAREREQPLSVLFCDLDHFKGFNDAPRPQRRRHACCARSRTSSSSRCATSTSPAATAARSSWSLLVETDRDAALAGRRAHPPARARGRRSPPTQPAHDQHRRRQLPATTASSRRSCSTRPTGRCTWPSAGAATGWRPSRPPSSAAARCARRRGAG